MDPSKFQASTSGRVIRQPQGYRAFLPAALPPGLTFTSALVARLSEADRALGELRGLGSALANPRLLIRPLARREAVLSSRLERINTLPVSLRLIREVHARLMEGVAGKEHLGGDVWTPGEFRRSQNWIGPTGSTIETAPYVPHRLMKC